VEASPQFTLDDVFNLQQAMIVHCEAMKYRVALLDPPDFGYPQVHVDVGEIQSWRSRFDSKFAALYFPGCWYPTRFFSTTRLYGGFRQAGMRRVCAR